MENGIIYIKAKDRYTRIVENFVTKFSRVVPQKKKKYSLELSELLSSEVSYKRGELTAWIFKFELCLLVRFSPWSS